MCFLGEGAKCCCCTDGGDDGGGDNSGGGGSCDSGDVDGDDSGGRSGGGCDGGDDGGDGDDGGGDSSSDHGGDGVNGTCHTLPAPPEVGAAVPTKDPRPLAPGRSLTNADLGVLASDVQCVRVATSPPLQQPYG